jgi:hypothetical protein
MALLPCEVCVPLLFLLKFSRVRHVINRSTWGSTPLKFQWRGLLIFGKSSQGLKNASGDFLPVLEGNLTEK